MNDVSRVKYALVSSLLTGFVFWLCLFGEYIISMLSRGYYPFDSVVLLIPILVFAVAIGLLLFFPFYLQLVRLNMGKISFVMPSAMIVSLCSALIITRQYTDYMIYISSLLGAIVGTLYFFKLLTRKEENSSE